MNNNPYKKYEYVDLLVAMAKGDYLAAVELQLRDRQQFEDSKFAVARSARKGDIAEIKLAERAILAADYKELGWIQEDLQEYREQRRKREESDKLHKELNLNASCSSTIPAHDNGYQIVNIWGK